MVAGRSYFSQAMMTALQQRVWNWWKRSGLRQSNLSRLRKADYCCKRVVKAADNCLWEKRSWNPYERLMMVAIVRTLHARWCDHA
jgi:hypothetical protein